MKTKWIDLSCTYVSLINIFVKAAASRWWLHRREYMASFPPWHSPLSFSSLLPSWSLHLSEYRLFSTIPPSCPHPTQPPASSRPTKLPLWPCTHRRKTRYPEVLKPKSRTFSGGKLSGAWETTEGRKKLSMWATVVIITCAIYNRGAFSIPLF
jgi:hypothetical protein